jgi:hypothetical protein
MGLPWCSTVSSPVLMVSVASFEQHIMIGKRFCCGGERQGDSTGRVALL